MIHPIHRVRSFEISAPLTLTVEFEDGTSQRICFESVLRGRMFGPLRETSLFNQVRLDDEAGTLVWPNGADFDPATLHDWPRFLPDLERQARQWANSVAAP